MTRGTLVAAAVFLLVLTACSHANNLDARLASAEGDANDAESRMDEAERDMAALEPDEAQAQLERARRKLSEGNADYYPEHAQLRQRLERDTAMLPEVRKAREKRDLGEAVARQRRKLDPTVPALRAAVTHLRDPAISEELVSKAKDAAGALEDALKRGQELEAKDGSYGRLAQGLRQELDHARDEAARAQLRVDFIAGPGGARKEAAALLAQAAREVDREKKAQLYTDGLDRLLQCSQRGSELLSANPVLAKAPLLLDGLRTTPQAVVVTCTRQARQTKRTVAIALARAKASPTGSKRKRTRTR